MAVNWQLGLVDSGLGAIEAFRAGQSARLQENQLRRQEQQFQRQEQARAQASQQFEAGDISGAQRTAIMGGDFDYARAVNSYGDDLNKQRSATQAITTGGKYAQELGYVPGTPEFRNFVLEYTKNDLARPYTGAGGETRLHLPNFVGAPQAAVGQAQPMPSVSPQQQPVIAQKPQGVSDDQIWAQAHEAVRNGADVNEVFRRLQAWGMNP